MSIYKGNMRKMVGQTVNVEKLMEARVPLHALSRLNNGETVTIGGFVIGPAHGFISTPLPAGKAEIAVTPRIPVLTSVERGKEIGATDAHIRIAVEDIEGDPVRDASVHIVVRREEQSLPDSIVGITNKYGIAEGTHKGFPLSGNLLLGICITTPQYEEMHKAILTADGLDETFTLGSGKETTESIREHHNEKPYEKLLTTLT